MIPRRVADVAIEPEGLKGFLGRPAAASGVVIFAHGSGSGRMSPRNNDVAESLREAGLATLLLDLLHPEEEENRRNVFDIPLLASRLRLATAWVRRQKELADLPIGYFGASTGAGAALVAAASDPDIGAVVSRGGRPDLASDMLPMVSAATLLIVGSLDTEVLELNRSAFAALGGPKELAVVPGAGHLFEEPGTLAVVSQLAQGWFVKHLSHRLPRHHGAFEPFKDRRDAGRRLATQLLRFKGQNAIVLALPRGGVPVAFEVAKAIGASLDLALVRKIGAPGFSELGIGAVVDGHAPEIVLNQDVVDAVRPAPGYIEREGKRQIAELERRRRVYRGGKPQPDIRGRTVIVVDDGIATGGTITAVIRALKRQEPARLVAAVPVAPASAIRALATEADEVIVMLAPEDFGAVGAYYEDFAQTSDAEVIALLRETDRPTPRQSDPASGLKSPLR
jgi:predicted phosphoribosyltransferase/dienelactone hydrolase